MDGRGIRLGRGRRAGKEGRAQRPDPAQPDPTHWSTATRQRRPGVLGTPRIGINAEPGAALARPEPVVWRTTGGERGARGVTGGAAFEL